MIQQITRRLALCLILAATAGLTGCFWMLVGAGAGAGTVAYKMGKLESTESAPLQKVYDASLAALESLQMPIRVKKVDGLAGRLEAKTADGKDVWITAERVTETTTDLTVRVGPIPDERRTRAIYDAIKSRL